MELIKNNRKYKDHLINDKFFRIYQEENITVLNNKIIKISRNEVIELESLYFFKDLIGKFQCHPHLNHLYVCWNIENDIYYWKVQLSKTNDYYIGSDIIPDQNHIYNVKVENLKLLNDSFIFL